MKTLNNPFGRNCTLTLTIPFRLDAGTHQGGGCGWRLHSLPAVPMRDPLLSGCGLIPHKQLIPFHSAGSLLQSKWRLPHCKWKWHPGNLNSSLNTLFHTPDSFHRFMLLTMEATFPKTLLNMDSLWNIQQLILILSFTHTKHSSKLNSQAKINPFMTLIQPFKAARRLLVYSWTGLFLLSFLSFPIN